MEPKGTVSQQAMQASIVAVSLAMLSRVRKSKSLRHAARKEYASALNLLNTALGDMEEAKTNQALGAVVLLAVYEVRHPNEPSPIRELTPLVAGCYCESPAGYRPLD